MIGKQPGFIDSPYFDIDTWTLKPGAPKEVLKEYEEYMANQSEDGFEPVD